MVSTAGIRGQKPLEIRQRRLDEKLAARILAGWRLCQQAQQIACFLNGLRLGFRSRGGQIAFKLITPRLQFGMILFDVHPEAAKLGCLLRRHATMQIEIGRLIRHCVHPLLGAAGRPCVIDRSARAVRILRPVAA